MFLPFAAVKYASIFAASNPVKYVSSAKRPANTTLFAVFILPTNFSAASKSVVTLTDSVLSPTVTSTTYSLSPNILLLRSNTTLLSFISAVLFVTIAVPVFAPSASNAKIATFAVASAAGSNEVTFNVTVLLIAQNCLILCM